MVRIQGWSQWATGGPQDSWLHVCVGAVDQEGRQELWSILHTTSSREDEALEGGARRQGDGIAPMSQAPCEDQDPGSQTSPVGSVAAASGPTPPLLCAALILSSGKHLPWPLPNLEQRKCVFPLPPREIAPPFCCSGMEWPTPLCLLERSPALLLRLRRIPASCPPQVR